MQNKLVFYYTNGKQYKVNKVLVCYVSKSVYVGEKDFGNRAHVIYSYKQDDRLVQVKVDTGNLVAIKYTQHNKTTTEHKITVFKRKAFAKIKHQVTI